MAEQEVGEGAATTLAGGTVLGGFGYSSTGADGWHVTQRRDLGGLSEDAVREGARLIERLTWWPGEPLAVGTDPYQRPRRLAWLGSGATPRRFLVHSIHAENDASSRPDNNYTECLVVAPAPDLPTPVRPAPGLPEGEAAADGVLRSTRSARPSQLWAVEGWATPWGAEAVAHARPGRHPLATSRPGREVVELVVGDPRSLMRLRCLLAAVHRALHIGGPEVVGVVDDLVWGAVLLDTALALMPPAAAWEVTFDLRSLPPAHRFSPNRAPGALVRLLGHSHQTSAVPAGTLDLTTECDEVRLEATLTQADDCPRCGQWHASMDRLLRQGVGVTPELLDRQLAELAEGMQPLVGLHSNGVAMDSPELGVGAQRVGLTNTPSNDGRTAQPAKGPPDGLTEPARRSTDDRTMEPARLLGDYSPTEPARLLAGDSPIEPARPSRDDSPAPRLYTPRNRMGGGRALRAGDQRGGGSPNVRPVPPVGLPTGAVELQALDQGVELLTDSRARLLGLMRGPAAARHLRATWVRVRELADVELARLGEDPTGGIPTVPGGEHVPDTEHDAYGRSDPW